MTTWKYESKKSCLCDTTFSSRKERKLYTILANVCVLGIRTFQNSKAKKHVLGSHSALYEISIECIHILIYDRHPNRFVSVHLYL